MNSLETLEHRPPWMDDNPHKLPEILPQPPHEGAKLTPVITVILTLTALLGPIFYQLDLMRFGPGPWHGLLVAALPFAPPPFFSYWSLHALTALTDISPIISAHIMNLAAAVLLFGAVAWIIAMAHSKRPGSLAAPVFLCAGLALLLPLHPLLSSALEFLMPGLLSAGLALVGLAVLLQPTHGASTTIRTIFAGGALGLATANEPAFLWVAIVGLFAYILFGSTQRPIEGFLGLLLGFAIAATWPFFHSISQGEPLAFFLSHALDHSAPGLNQVQWDMGPISNIGWLAILFLVAAPLGIGHAIYHRDYAFSMISLGSLLFMGPLHKTFMTANDAPALMPQSEGPALFAIAMLMVLSGRGGLALLEHSINSFGKQRLHAAAAICFFLLTLGVVSRDLMAPWEDSRPLAMALADELPEGAIVICSDPALMSYWELHHAEKGDTATTTLLFRNDFSHWWGRVRMARMDMEDLKWRSLPLSREDLNRWQGEQTFYLQEVLPDIPSASEKHFAGLRLWDFVVKNRHKKPLYFAGARDSWIVAQTAPEGPYLRTGHDTGSMEPPDFQPSLKTIETLPNAPGVEALSLAMSWAARLQGAHEAAIQFAEAASQQGDRVSGEAARIRGLARSGNTDEAMDAVDAYWEISPTSVAADALQRGIQSAFQASRAERELHAALEREDGPMFSEDAESLLTPLWEAQELRPLANVFYKVSQKNPDDLNALYQLAAIQALMGAYREADETLQKWTHRGQFRFGDIDRQLQQDFRFRPFRIHWQQKSDILGQDDILSGANDERLPFRKDLVYP